MQFLLSIARLDDMNMPHGESMLRHHAFHIGITLAALAAVAVWWLFDKRSKK